MKDDIKQGFCCFTKDKCKYNPNCRYLKDYDFMQERLDIERKNRETIIMKWFECCETLEIITKICKNANYNSNYENCFVSEIIQKSNELLEKNKKDFESLKKVYKQKNKDSNNDK